MKLETIIEPIEKGLDSIKFKVKKKLNLFDPVFIYTYRSYGNNEKVVVKGRVMEKERVIHDDEVENSIWHNLYRFYKRYESDEIPGVELEVSYHDKSYTTTTDDEGFYQLEIPIHKTESPPFWDTYKIRITKSPIDLKQEDVSATGEIMIPDAESEFGIISDVDDTIIESHATNFWLKIKTLATSHAHTRIAFRGVAAFYRALLKVDKDRYKNPLWFISGSSWNIYDLLDRFCEDKGIPKAPFLLRKLNIDANKFIKSDTISYKKGQIIPLLEFTDPLPFILIGDSGQKDPEIYQEIVDRFPGRIKAIYIRDVTSDQRDGEVRKIAKELKKKNVDMILASNSSEAAKHAFDNNWISEKDLKQVQKEVKKDSKEK